ncbi:MAG TPA: TlyA family rRNA (cytidine-2'-O)-methyltransferase [Ruminococcaceae bacterium]|nr:TlyA family rRNA (cytidine-2'-O)-methyltransferase [Oscillospiraceae bacterium]
MKTRLDTKLVQLGLVSGRDKAKAVIMAGIVYVNGQKADKAGFEVKEDDKIELRGETLRYVSRGGLKLEKALSSFPIQIQDAVCMDIGASTGGFTDCMLQNGAKKVYAIDVGYGQLAWKLRTDTRVVNLERTNFRRVTRELVAEPVDFASVDVSFISLTLILPTAYPLLSETGEMICLIKPQFEAGKGMVGKKGVVKDPQIHFETIVKVIDFAIEAGFSVLGLTFSPVKGPEGNIEYLVHLKKEAVSRNSVDHETIGSVVETSHAQLDKQ